ncbi:MAG: hypothetical protein ACUVWP_01140 [bacterium]
MRAHYIIFIIFGLVVIIAMFIPGSSKKSSDMTMAVYNAIEGLPEGSIVLVGADFDAANRAEMVPQMEALVRHIMKRHLKIIAISMWDQSPMFAERILRKIGDEEGLKYGIDYVNLGYAAGAQSMVHLLKDDVSAVFKTDFSGNRTVEMPIMRDIKGAGDVPLMVDISDNPSGPTTYLEQIKSFNRDFRLVCSLTASAVPPIMPYVESGQIEGYIIGLKGASEYEGLIGKRGLGTISLSAQSVGQALILVFIVIGNLAFFWMRRVKGKENAVERK